MSMHTPRFGMQSLVETNRWKWSKRRRQALIRDGHRCQLRLEVCTIEATEVDHIRPRVAGGGDELENLRSVCHACHAARGLAEGTNVGPPRSRFSITSRVVTQDYTRRHDGGR